MRQLTGLGDKELLWIQPRALDRWFELWAGDEQLASLSWETMCGSLARAETADGSWTFKRVGFLNPRVTVRESGSQVNLATFWPRWLGDGTLEFASGRRFRWQSTNFWATHWMFTSYDGTPLVHFRQGSPDGRISEVFKTQAAVEIQPHGQAVTELGLLILIGWYLSILRHDDAAAGAAAS